MGDISGSISFNLFVVNYHSNNKAKKHKKIWAFIKCGVSTPLDDITLDTTAVLKNEFFSHLEVQNILKIHAKIVPLNILKL